MCHAATLPSLTDSTVVSATPATSPPQNTPGSDVDMLVWSTTGVPQINRRTSSGTARMLVKPLRKTTKTLLAPHRRAEVAQSKAVSPAPRTMTLPWKMLDMKALMSSCVGQDFWHGASAHFKHLAASFKAPRSLKVSSLFTRGTNGAEKLCASMQLDPGSTTHALRKQRAEEERRVKAAAEAEESKAWGMDEQFEKMLAAKLAAAEIANMKRANARAIEEEIEVLSRLMEIVRSRDLEPDEKKLINELLQAPDAYDDNDHASDNKR
ncbi:unnamed protein product [Notodromas monacha]|uniref:Uncharacterized protein n=1 Tax=Notodromas monacha TaxID=399045 RepID=A0A7R9BWQ4_9CRUS|nr:unnamed protein product [Notodromas monacha]CAG0921809.1 unnamed protein product [Notodromas monacha]